MKGTMMDYPLTLTAILDRAEKLFPKVEVVSRMPDKSLHRTTYAEVARRARLLAEALLAAGLRPGDRVATLCFNHRAHLEAYFGVPAAGGVVHTLNPRLHPNDLEYIMGHAEDRFLVLDDVLWPVFERVRERVRLEQVFVVPLTGKPVPPGTQSYEDLLASAKGDFRYPEIREDDAAEMCYTSGTTGRPKGVLYSHRALVLHSFVICLPEGVAISQRDAITPVVPMFHANGWGIPYAATMIGAKQVFPGPHLDGESLLDLFERERVTVAAGVPTIWMGILQALEKEPNRWHLPPGMRLAVGGSAAPESMIRAFDRHGIRIIHAWGMTEMTPVGTVSLLKSHLLGVPEDEAYRLRATQGVPIPFVDVRVRNESGEVPWDGKSLGELEVRGPWIAASYYRLEDTSDRWTADGWFRTGDVVSIDPEGYVKIADRTKDLIKSGGEWISSVDLENALMGHPSVREAAVIAVPDEKWGERPLAVVVAKDAATVTPDQLRDFLSPNFAKWALPDAFVFTNEIPRTSTGKFSKVLLRERFGTAPPRGPVDPPP